MNSTSLGNLVWIDVRRYVVKGGKLDGLLFENSEMLKMWPNVKSTPDGYDGYYAALDIRRGWRLGGYPSSFFAYASQTSLRVWVGLCEQLAERAGKGIPPPPLGQIVNCEHMDRLSVIDYLKKRSDVRLVPPAPAHGDRVPLHKLGPQHDAETLEWASEFLAMNIETFGFMTEVEADWDVMTVDAKAFWPEIEDGTGIGETQAGASSLGRLLLLGMLDARGKAEEEESDQEAVVENDVVAEVAGTRGEHGGDKKDGQSVKGGEDEGVEKRAGVGGTKKK